MKSSWSYQVSYTDSTQTQNDHLIVLKRDAMKVVSRAISKGYEVTIKRI